MQRREFIALLGATAAASSLSWPSPGSAQQPAAPLLGFLSSSSLDHQQDRLRAMRQGLGEMGYVEGQNLTIEYRWAEGQSSRLPDLAADLVRRKVSVIVASDGPNTAHPARAATQTIPIVFQTGTDPVKDGLVTSMERSGGNVTAVTRLSGALEPTRLDFLHAIAPQATRIALMLNPNSRLAEGQANGVQAAARGLGLDIEIVNVSSEQEIEPAFAALDRRRVGALVIASDALFFGRTARLGALALSHGLPTAYETREFAEAGGLVSYGASLMDSYRRVGAYAGRLLKGERVADMPVGQPAKFEFMLNRKTASTLGLTIPQALLARADETVD